LSELSSHFAFAIGLFSGGTGTHTTDAAGSDDANPIRAQAVFKTVPAVTEMGVRANYRRVD
jgi:hypothetical protein